MTSDLHGTWLADPAHSSLAFAIRHMGVSTFRGELRDFEATLAAEANGASLRGLARVASISTREDVIARQLLAPEFLDADRHPQLRLDADALAIAGEHLSGVARLTMRGVSRPVELRGALAGPVVDPFGSSRLGLELATTIDRTDWGIDWNAPLPGGGRVLDDAVAITAHLELVRERTP